MDVVGLFDVGEVASPVEVGLGLLVFELCLAHFVFPHGSSGQLKTFDQRFVNLIGFVGLLSHHDLFVSHLLSDLFELQVSVCLEILLAQLCDL